MSVHSLKQGKSVREQVSKEEWEKREEEWVEIEKRREGKMVRGKDEGRKRMGRGRRKRRGRNGCKEGEGEGEEEEGERG